MSECPCCGNEYNYLSTHIQQSLDCDFPEMDENKKKILTGLLMGDGNISNGTYQIHMTNKEFLEYIKNQLEPWSSSINKIRDKEENVTMPHGGISDTKAVYSLGIRSHPFIKELESWFYSGKKKFPDDLNLSPKVVKMWYVSDGGLNWNNYSRANAQITSLNEINRRSYFVSKFEEIGFDIEMSGKTIRIKTNDTKNFLNWLGSPPPGFEYKWENEKYFEYLDKIGNSSHFQNIIESFKEYEYHSIDVDGVAVEKSGTLNNSEIVERAKEIFDELNTGRFGSYRATQLFVGCLKISLEEHGCFVSYEENYEKFLNSIEEDTEQQKRVNRTVKKHYRKI